MNMINFLFDIDGTLTPPRQKIPRDLRDSFGCWIVAQQDRGNKVFFVTGSDRDKTVEQVGLPLWRAVDGSYQCCGNQLYKRGSLIKESRWRMSVRLHLDLMIIIEKSTWFGSAKKNIEQRVGMVNVTTIGRAATKKQRAAYYEWDKVAGERKKIVETLSRRHPRLECSIGGEISVDIYPKGKNKSQILDDIAGRTVFFGDKCDKDGNDYHISHKSGLYYHVKDWQETKKILETVYG